MAAGLMRIFGGTTRTQLVVIGLVLAILGAIGAFGVMFYPNEDPASVIETGAKEKVYNWVSVWAILALLIVMAVGIVLLGVALTGIPLVHMAKYHVGVFYVSLFGLLLVPAAVSMQMGSTLLANAASETAFVEGLAKQDFTSPAGLIALAIGAALMVLCLLFLLANLLALARVAYRPSLVRGGALMGSALVVAIIVSMATVPFLTAVDINYELGTREAEGFADFDPTDVSLTPGWLKWLSKGEFSSTYGDLSFWLVLMGWFLFFALIVSVVGFIGLALYSANERKETVTQMSLVPMGAAGFSFLAILFYLFFNAALKDLSDKMSISSDITKLTYDPGTMWVVFLLGIAIITITVFYGMALRQWLQVMVKGKRVKDPISMASMVDPPTGLPSPPTGWPPRWNKMSNANVAVVSVAVILVLAGFGAGFYVKRGEEGSSDINLGSQAETIDLDSLSDEESVFTWNDYAAEGGIRPVFWNPDGDWFITGMKLYVSWTDEPARFRHQNEPDEFEGSINATNGEGASATGQSTTTTLTGELTLLIDFEQYIITTDLTGVELPPEAVEADIFVNITCTLAGDQTPAGPGLLVFPDDGNDFTATLTVYYKLYTRQQA